MLRNARPPWIAVAPPVDATRRQALEKAGARVLAVPPNDAGQINLVALLAQLVEQGIGSVMVEGGASVITSFLAARLVDRVVLTIAPMLVGGLAAVGELVQANGVGFPRLQNPRYDRLGDDMVLSGNVIWKDGG